MTDIRKIPQKYKTSDGREFAADQEEAFDIRCLIPEIWKACKPPSSPDFSGDN